jgi:mRNA interferase RelE/StbE
LVVARSARKDIDKLDRITKQRIAKKLDYYLKQDDPLASARQLIDSKLGAYRFRVGHYRIVFDVNSEIIEVVAIKHRKDVYKR